MSIIVKHPDEIMPIIFDFEDRLGELAAGARIIDVLGVDIKPSGDVDDLRIENVAIDQVGERAVQGVASKGRLHEIYKPACKAQVSHAGHTYEFEVQLTVFVR